MPKENFKDAITWIEKVLPITQLKPAEYNPRKKISGSMRKSLRDSLKRFGHAVPVVCNQDLTIIGGHQTVDVAMNDLGWTEIKVHLPSRQIAEPEAKAFNIALNKIKSDWDDLKLGQILKELGEI